MLSEVREWLERGGLAFEMDVARRVGKYTDLLTQGEHYIDPVSQQEREIDVTGLLADPVDRSFTHFVEVIAECKATTAPWILFVGPTWANGPWEPVLNAQEDCPRCEAITLKLEELHRRLPTAYSITEKHAEKAVDHAYQAFQQVTNATLAGFKDGPGWSSHGSNVATVFGVPIVVTRSPLVLCSLSDSGDIDLATVRMAEVGVRRTDVPDSEGVGVIAVNIDALDDLMSELATRAPDLMFELASGSPSSAPSAASED